MKRVLIYSALFLVNILCVNNAWAQKPTKTIVNKTISINSEPEGAKVVINGNMVGVTPCQATIPVTETLSGKSVNDLTQTQIKVQFIKDGKSEYEVFQPSNSEWNGKKKVRFFYPDGVFHLFRTPVKKVSNRTSTAAEKRDPTIAKGEAQNMVSRDKPGQSELERTIIRWAFDSDPRGARIFWRVISSIPAVVKNTNETYLMTTPYEETRSFNILGLTYENSRDVTIEVKLRKAGYEDQVKRFNVRQAIDQQEISAFFELVKKVE
ncbi:MAG: PEGA domain-containing protein [Alistipes sp.]|nr:PEGA domain-containing protein [Alistipes sp.]